MPADTESTELPIRRATVNAGSGGAAWHHDVALRDGVCNLGARPLSEAVRRLAGAAADPLRFDPAPVGR